MDLHTLSIQEASEGLTKKEFSSVELTKACLGQIKKTNPLIHANLTISEDKALSQAKTADEILKNGESNPLLGIPFTMKDTYCTEDIRTTASSKILEHYIPVYSSEVYLRLRNKHAILLAKDNCDAWGHGASTENSDFGVTKNPWNLGYVVGGSSGGSAAVVTSDMAMFAIGEDTGGSIRQPASFCNVVGLKVTYGRVSRFGAIAYASSLDSMGPIGKTVADCAYILEAIAGKDQKDATSSPLTVDNYSSYLLKGVKGKRIGLPKEFFSEGIDAEVKTLVLAAAKKYAEMGARVVETSLPSMKYAIAAYYLIAPSETSSNLARYDGIRYGNPRSFFGDEAKRRIMIGTYALSSGYYDQYYAKAQKIRTLICQDFEDAFRNVDCLLAPVSPTTPFKIGEKSDDPLSMYLADAYTVPINLAGVPSLAMPCGFTKNNLPVGMQIVAPQFKEALLFQVGNAYEQATQWHKRKPNLNY